MTFLGLKGLIKKGRPATMSILKTKYIYCWPTNHRADTRVYGKVSHSIIMIKFLGASIRPTNLQTNKQTHMRVHRKVTLPTISLTFRSGSAETFLDAEDDIEMTTIPPVFRQNFQRPTTTTSSFSSGLLAHKSWRVCVLFCFLNIMIYFVTWIINPI